MPRPLSCSLALAFAFLAAACGEKSQSPSQRADAPMTIEERGRMAFAACAVCHSVRDPEAPGYATMVGPSLYRVVGARAGHVATYDYSQAMRESGLVWDEATLDAFLENPQQIVPRTRMAYVGEKNADRRAALIAYLKTLQ